MVPPLPQDDFSPFDFSSEILCRFNFGAEFDFGREFSFAGDGASTSSWSFGSFDYDDVSISCSNEDGFWRCCNGRCNCRCRQRPNCMYRIESMKTSCWYREFLKPGPVRDLTYELSSLDRFLEFCSFFSMPLSKVAELVEEFIHCGYLGMPRGFSRRAEYCERAELLIMYVLHILAKGATFRNCCMLTHITTSKVCMFFFDFLDALVDMKDEVCCCLSLLIGVLSWLSIYMYLRIKDINKYH